MYRHFCCLVVERTRKKRPPWPKQRWQSVVRPVDVERSTIVVKSVVAVALVVVPDPVVYRYF